MIENLLKDLGIANVKRKLKLEELYEFFNFLNSLMALGYGMETSINFILSSLDKKQAYLKQVFTELKLYLSRGQALSDFIDKTNYIDKSYLPLILTGEKTGTLALPKNNREPGQQSIFEIIINDLKEKIELYKKVKSAMTYPIIIITVLFLLIIALTYKILPQIMKTLMDMAGGDVSKFPPQTYYMYKYLEFMKAHGTEVWIGFAGVIGSIVYLFKSGKIFEYLQDNFFKIPIIGNIYKLKFYMSFFDNLNTFYSVGYDTVTALKFLKQNEKNVFLRKYYTDAVFKLEQGLPLHKILDPRLFEHIAITLVKQGEKGNLGEQFKYLIEHYKDKLLKTFEQVQSLIQPILLLVVGTLMGSIMVSLVKGIYGFMALLGQ
ncbi:general secretory pathway protein F (plasmid) [Deferribacter desulfuricans SSM1]|uniref:General secretory pathway protein F n=1 Tax=Deferribacter desulfuricans (strain DSM 14783 / JCM 11476 / NBRC 101012 / SSM1) TaxID=639282 RepID=D3PEK8_DEFDS|nr:type II secretion system F family protein [Deferribacter desulfuricans]BAI81650.1 general secretory pathway protein F [Deferribacter desulfuricans SSM1]